MATDPDWTDPCAILAWLRPQYYKIVAGAKVIRTQHENSSVTFSEINSKNVAAVFRQLEDACARSQGLKGRRAIVAG